MSNSATNKDTVTIAVMGATGAGKSTASIYDLVFYHQNNSRLRVGYGLESCTSEVQVGSPFLLDGKTVTLIDTPGFDDTTKTEAEILKLIADFLAITYEQGRKLNGVIFLHRISDQRMGGVARKNFRLFRKLCGDDALKNVVIVTNMWGEVDQAVGENRERELAFNELFFKPVLDKGARMVRHENTPTSAKRILRELLGFPPEPLLIQRETVDEHKSLAQTDAGIDLQAELDKAAEQHRKELDDLRREMAEVMDAKDSQKQEELNELNAAFEGVRGQLNKLAEENKVLREERDDEQERHEQQMKQLVAAMEEKEAEFRSLQRDVDEHKSRITQMEAALAEAEKRADDHERSRQKAEADLQAFDTAHKEELGRVRKDLEEKLLSAQRDAVAREPQSQTYAQQQWAKVFIAQREKRGIFGALGVMVEHIIRSGTTR
ncbi:hypothetical protein EIP86_004828 [Pleurotus ostreatoroseus]|nr:hypothetical protein EIP86_004828 [Pleurotus ostreatoroseus]